MTKADFQEWLQKQTGPVYLDGATGSNLIQKGMPSGTCPEKWILEHAGILKGLQEEYVEAGTRILYAPTFTANRVKLREYGLEGQIEEMNHCLVALSREASRKKALVAADLTMTGEQLAPMGRLDFEELVDIYKEQIAYVTQAGADLLVVETMMSLQECRAALIAAKESCDLPVMVSMTFEADGRSLFGTDAKTAAVVLSSLGAAAVGANCSTGPDGMAEVIRQMAQVTDIPLIAKPNAGLPAVDSQGRTVYDMDAQTFGREMKALVEAGAVLLGGCCGTTPAHIRALVEATGKMPVNRRKTPGLRYLASERKTLAFGLEEPLIIVGERINPTGKKALQAELRQGSLERVLAFAREQEADGAQVLDVNVGMSGIDERATMRKVVEAVSEASWLPLSIDSSHGDVVEEALRRYPGRALINSISYEAEKMKRFLPIARKYGAMFILLPLSDKGLPENLEEKKQIIRQIMEQALALGLRREDIVVDGLVATAGANPRAALDVLETIRFCREQGLATICGLSNISFGLPERGFVNAAFVSMAIGEGLTMAIANPSQALLMNSAYAASLLACRKEGDVRYIERMNGASGSGSPESPAPAADGSRVGSGPEDAASKVRDGVLKGNRQGIRKLTEEALAEGIEPKKLLDETLLPAINEVGELFDKGKYFLPQLIAGAEAMKRSIECLEPLLAESKEETDMPVIVIATVKGDIHDIGKNLVALMLRNYGFQVIDLGKDVPRETIVAEAEKHRAKIIALSALMTTTMQEMRRVVEHARERGITAKIMIGGAVITPEYAEEIGADGYSKDAAEAVRLAKRLTGMTEV